MKRRGIPGTELRVSPVGLGTVALGRTWHLKYPSPKPLPTDRELDLLLSTAAELGINLLDTAPAYGSSEERLGKWLSGRREGWVISTKVGERSSPRGSTYDFRPRSIRRSVEESLRRLRLDELDLVLVHSDGRDLERLDALEELSKLKEEGRIRGVGISVKTAAGGLAAIPRSDVIMTTYGPRDGDEHRVLDEARGRSAILLKKVLESGRRKTPEAIAGALAFALSHPATTSVVIGTTNPEHLRRNVGAAEEILSK